MTIVQRVNLSCQKAHYFFCRLKDDTDDKQLQIDDRAIGGSVQHDGTPAQTRSTSPARPILTRASR